MPCADKRQGAFTPNAEPLYLTQRTNKQRILSRLTHLFSIYLKNKDERFQCSKWNILGKLPKTLNKSKYNRYSIV